jgi:hypothetical protein
MDLLRIVLLLPLIGFYFVFAILPQRRRSEEAASFSETEDLLGDGNGHGNGSYGSAQPVGREHVARGYAEREEDAVKNDPIILTKQSNTSTLNLTSLTTTVELWRSIRTWVQCHVLSQHHEHHPEHAWSS